MTYDIQYLTPVQVLLLPIVVYVAIINIASIYMDPFITFCHRSSISILVSMCVLDGPVESEETVLPRNIKFVLPDSVPDFHVDLPDRSPVKRKMTRHWEWGITCYLLVRPMLSENKAQKQNRRPVSWNVFCGKRVLADVLPGRF